MNEKYLFYIDILGFEQLAGEIAAKKGIDQRDIRKKFIEVINEKVEKLDIKGKISGKKYAESDDWLLVTDSLDKVFYCINEILDHYTGYRGFEKIPLEIAIGTGEYDKWARFNGTNLIVEESTIKFLKINIIREYHKWYKINHSQSPESTYILFTESAYLVLESLDKKICKKTEFKYKKNDGSEELINLFVAEVAKFQQRSKAFEFLEKIEYFGNKWYGHIDELYVPPLEYEEILNTLKEKRIVFIIGTQELGKTYTAVRLLWNYYINGYVPRWIRGGEMIERVEMRKKLENIKAELKPRHIIYFEDPFGKTKYEKRETLEREIGIIIDVIKQAKDTLVVITSREEIFKEFEKEKLSATQLREFETQLNIKKPSYNYEKRKEILLKLAEAEKCKWLENENLKKFVFQFIKNKNILPTPLSIKGFSVATIDVDNENKLKEIIIEKSNETPRAFADEIRNMSHDKILFLSILSFSSHFEIKFAEEIYQKTVKELNLAYSWEFDKILNWFVNDKINIVNNKYIEFSHPSYSEALPYLISDFTGIIAEIFSKLLFELTKKYDIAIAVAWAVAGSFDKSLKSANFQSLLVNKQFFNTYLYLEDFNTYLEDKNYARNAFFINSVWDVASAVINNFYQFPEAIRNELLLILSEKEKASCDVAWIVANNFKRFPKDTAKNLLVKLSDKDKTAEAIAWVIANNFDELDEDVRDLLFKLSENDNAIEAVAWAVANNYNKFPKETAKSLLLKLSRKNIKVVSRAVSSNIRKLVDVSEDELYFKLLLRVEAILALQNAYPPNMYELIENNIILPFKLSTKDKSAWIVAWFIAYNFDKFDAESINRLLLKLSTKESSAWAIGWALAYNFDKLPPEIGDLFVRWEIVLFQVIAETVNELSNDLESFGLKNIVKAKATE